jgi:hypothetical protein
MTPETAAAFVTAAATRALLRMEAMKAANHERTESGLALAYGEEAFLNVIVDEGIGHNSVVTTINNALAYPVSIGPL